MLAGLLVHGWVLQGRVNLHAVAISRTDGLLFVVRVCSAALLDIVCTFGLVEFIGVR